MSNLLLSADAEAFEELALAREQVLQASAEGRVETVGPLISYVYDRAA